MRRQGGPWPDRFRAPDAVGLSRIRIRHARGAGCGAAPAPRGARPRAQHSPLRNRTRGHGVESAFAFTPLVAAKLIVYTFGSLVHLFLMVLILGQRRLRTFEWLLFWLMLCQPGRMPPPRSPQVLGQRKLPLQSPHPPRLPLPKPAAKSGLTSIPASTTNAAAGMAKPRKASS